MSFWGRVRNHTVPHTANVYRPYLLRREWMAVFLAMVLAAEGFLVASLVARQSAGPFLATVAVAEGNSTINSVTRAFVQSVDNPSPTTQAILGAVALLLSALIVATFIVRVQVQPMDMLAPAAVVVGIALFFLACNAWVLNSNAGQVAATWASQP